MIRTEGPQAPNLLLRTGPFIPPISFPFTHIVVTDEFRNELSRSNLGEFEYRAIEKHRIKKLRWEQWDRTTEVPPKTPRGEPADYYLSGRHSRAAAKAMGRIWELSLPRGGVTGGVRIERDSRRTPGQPIWDVMIDPDTWLGGDFFRSTNQGYLIATERGAQWLTDHCKDWVTLIACLPWDPDRLDASNAAPPDTN